MRAARVIVIMFLTFAILGLVCANILKPSMYGVGFFSFYCCIATMVALYGCIQNSRWQNLLVVVFGTSATVTAFFGMWLSQAGFSWEEVLGVFIPATLSWVIGAGFFFLRTTREHPSLGKSSEGM